MRVELKALVGEAVRSLAKLDADRLEELALSCQELNRDLVTESLPALARETRAAKREMAALALMLEATGTNAAVMKRLRQLRTSRTEYTVREPQVKKSEVLHGLH
jgi:hypothetical protein